MMKLKKKILQVFLKRKESYRAIILIMFSSTTSLHVALTYASLQCKFRLRSASWDSRDLEVHSLSSVKAYVIAFVSARFVVVFIQNSHVDVSYEQVYLPPGKIFLKVSSFAPKMSLR